MGIRSSSRHPSNGALAFGLVAASMDTPVSAASLPTP